MNMHDPNLGNRMELRAMETRILSKNPHVKRRSSVRSAIITLVISLVLLGGILLWIGSLEPVGDSTDQTTGQR